MKIKLTKFERADFDQLIAWLDTKELLLTIAGTVLTYPLTREQLVNYVNDPKSLSFNVVDVDENKSIGHAEIILTGVDTCKLDKVLIGDKSMRGKGIGDKLMRELLRYSFEELNMNEVELNVYDWNQGAIRCYEKVGFVINPEIVLMTDLDDIHWKTLNMRIDKDKWNGVV